ncbi:hypothetical protein UA45_00395 [Morganella morganii]|uniref:Uncharacterized protein n=1 Tax=Morganella morganii TaxID=582 RepID=A0A0D8LC07_MORMO|nr:hypothetical protein UA45_00395 [Morganella morganii]
MTIKIEVTTELIMSLYARLGDLFPWQKRWYYHRFQRKRYLHKGRQIGADYYFALEAVLDACLTGRNKIFIEPAPTEPENTFISNTAQYATLFLGRMVQTKSQIIKLSNGAEIRFLPENHPCWAGLSGDTYVSEWAWFDNPRDMIKIVMGITMHKKWRRTYYSSRDGCDNGAEVVFREKSYFYDVVPFMVHECGEQHCSRRPVSHGFYKEHQFRQLFLCQSPEAV